MSNNVHPLVRGGNQTPPAVSPEPDAQCPPDVQALRLAKCRFDASAADIARWCDTDRRTVERWLSGERPIRLAKLINSKRFFPVFAECLDEVLERLAA